MTMQIDDIIFDCHYDTRDNLMFRVPYSRTEAHRQFVLARAVVIWNALPAFIRDLNLSRSFFKAAKIFLLQQQNNDNN